MSHYSRQGNGEDLGVTASYVLELSASLKTSILCYDYSGYGVSTGKPSEANCFADIRAAYSYLVSEQRISPNRIVLFGRSLGSGPTIDLAVSLGSSLGGVVLIAALMSCVRVVFTNAPYTPMFDMFANVDKIARVQVPIFCVHGMEDEVVPFNHGMELCRRARYPVEPLWVRDAGHNNLESSRFQYEVFLRYMKVLEEFRRWKRPENEHEVYVPKGRRRESFPALGNVAGCFVPLRGQKDEDGVNVKGRGSSSKKRTRASGGSTGQLSLHQRMSSDHETEVEMWKADVEPQNMPLRRASGETFRSSSIFEEGKKVGRDSRSLANVHSVEAVV